MLNPSPGAIVGQWAVIRNDAQPGCPRLALFNVDGFGHGRVEHCHAVVTDKPWPLSVVRGAVGENRQANTEAPEFVLFGFVRYIVAHLA